jgi:hypothetical protein
VTHDEIIEALEKATGPSLVLDAAIGSIAYRATLGDCPRTDDGGWQHPQFGKVRCPAYTACIDDALTLVPEGWWLTGMGEQRSPIFDAGETHDATGFFFAKVQHVQGGRLQIATGRSLALALCVAAMKARRGLA